MNDRFDISEIELSDNDLKRGLILPTSPSKELSEIIGILVGDGFINLYRKYDYIVEISGDSRLDREYLSVYVTRLIKRLFNISSSLLERKDQRTMYLRIRSKGLMLYLHKIGFKKGKKDQIQIPFWILKRGEYFKSFIMGLSDTDFSLVLLNRKQKNEKYYPRISIRSKSKVLVKEIDKWFLSKGFRTYTQYDYIQKDNRGYNDSILHSLHINGRKNLEKWMNLISFRNQRHLSRYGLLMGAGRFELPIVEDKQS